MPTDLPMNWALDKTERNRAFSIKMPNLFLIVMLILYAACFLAMIDGYQHNIIFPIEGSPEQSPP